ncbi:MAG TPA: HlyD family efflux transporter periplasmic adaptor subunit [Caulobacteraceae bacterium]|nr:HlyD family efflux transporter periplasmic adaptor subunit [Caulobacteraceae bacterium]
MLPELREEIVVYPGPTNYAGEPSWTIHDPTRNRFFRIDWLTFEILGRWSYRDPAVIADSVNAHSPLHVTEEDVDGVGRFLVERELIRAAPGSAAFLKERLNQRKKSWWEWLMHHYLFVRLPLVKPDAWLGRHVNKVRFFASSWFFRLTLVALVFGLWQVVQQWDQLRSEFVDTITPAGAAAYIITLGLVKVAHELGHAFVSKNYGARVPTMGVALLIMMPVAYTDTTDTWKLDDKHQRLKVACAGVAVELTIAIWATALLPFIADGPLRTIVFLLATTTWVSAVIVNFNPLMRFDGYFILSDWLDIPNLHDRAFAITRWRIRQVVLGLNEPPPEHFPPATERWLIALAFVTWIYRLGLYLGIAFLVYHFTVKLIGILLFIVEMWWFILKPIVGEMKQWWEKREAWWGNTRTRRIMITGGVILALLAVPMPAPVRATAMLSPTSVHFVYAPEAGQVTSLRKLGERLEEGELVATIQSPAAASQRRVSEAQVATLREQLAGAAFDPDQRAQLLTLQSELAAAEAELANTAQQVDRLDLRAPFDGKVVDLDPDLRAGDWVPKGSAIAVVVTEGAWRAVAYLEGEEASRVKVGDHAKFIPEGLKAAPVTMVVEQVDPDSTRALPSGVFAATAGGDVLVRPKDDKLVPEKAVYRVRLRAEEAPEALVGHSWRGQVVIQGAWSPPGWRYLRTALAVLVREAGF